MQQVLLLQKVARGDLLKSPGREAIEIRPGTDVLAAVQQYVRACAPEFEGWRSPASTAFISVQFCQRAQRMFQAIDISPDAVVATDRGNGTWIVMYAVKAALYGGDPQVHGMLAEPVNHRVV